MEQERLMDELMSLLLDLEKQTIALKYEADRHNCTVYDLKHPDGKFVNVKLLKIRSQTLHDLLTLNESVAHKSQGL